MKPFALNVKTFVLRLYLMMALVLIGGFSGQWLIALLGLPVFLSAMFGIKFGATKDTRHTPIVGMKQNTQTRIPHKTAV
ncbi:MAG: hypothetical protein D6714_14470 [Bacteroidetes bacterium]|nr:MAG: hypothetical protein D6714_14470 [Bacteroidota bacterium]